MRPAIIVIAALLAGPAASQCNPPPPNLTFDQWTSICPNEIQYAYSVYGNGMDFGFFVQSLYGLHLNPPAAGGVQPLGQCSPEGSTQCNGSGWLYTCTGGQWITGSVQC